ncbi:MFS transporter [Clostridiaceae bacterium 35-E11]
MEEVKIVLTQKQTFKKYAWFTLLGFSLMYGFVYNGRFNMEWALPQMMKELDWSKSEIGWITSLIYCGYSVGNFVNGRLGEIYGCKRFILAGVLLTIMTNWIVSFSTSIVIIAALWGANGYFQSMIWAPGMSLISKWWPSHQRGFAAGFAHGFSGMAHIILWLSILLTEWIAPSWGWKGIFRIPVTLLLLMASFYWMMSKEQPGDVYLDAYEEQDGEIRQKEKDYYRLVLQKGKLFPYRCLFSQWRFCIWCLISALASIARYGLLTWIPLYYAEQMQLHIRTGIFHVLILPTGMTMGTFLVPWATDKFFGKNRAPAVIICGALSALLVFIFPSMTTSITVAVSIFWAGFFVYGINGVLWPYAIDVGTRAFAGTAAGILDWSAYMGAAVQAMVFGSILDKTEKWAYVFVSIAILCVLIVILGIIVTEHKEENEIRKAA